MPYSVFIQTVPAQWIAASRRRTTFAKIAAEIGPLLGPVWSFLKQNPGLRSEGHNVAIYWRAANGGDIEVGVQVTREFSPTAEIVCSSTPAAEVACTAHWGPYNRLGDAHDAVREWCTSQGREARMPCWEIYGDWSDDPAQLRTDVFYLLAARL